MCESSREETLTKQKRWFVVGCSKETNKKTTAQKKHWLFPPAANGANGRVDSSFHHTFNTRAARNTQARAEGRARDFAAVHRRPSTAEAHASTAPHTEAADPRQATNPWRPRRFAAERRDGLSMIDAASSPLAVPAVRHLVVSRLKTVHAISSAVIAKHPTRNDYFGIAEF